MKIQMKEIRNHLIAIAVFVAVVLIYFSPSIFGGKEIPQGDMIKYKGMSEEVRRYAETPEGKANDVVAWTGSMFSGMPTYHITVPGTPVNSVSYLEKPVKSIDYLGGSMVLTGLICFYILMCVMGVRQWLAVAGSIAFALASYNLIIIAAGHITKAYVIGYMPLTIAGLILVFRQKWLLGSALTTLGIVLSIMNNHIQITYYLALFCFVIYLGYSYGMIRRKEYKVWGKITGILVACVLVAVLPNLGNLYANAEMSKESMRGPTELTEKVSKEKVSSGLDIDYAFSWSYGKAETMTLLIPNFYGGSSGGELGKNSNLYKTLRSNGYAVGDKIQSYTYWGDQPFTSGPVYFGALVCFLFVLGMFVIKNPLKWWILGGTVFFIFLSWGNNFMALNEFLFHHLPLYNKFRTPSMSLVIPGLVFPIVGMWGLKEILTQQVEMCLLKKALYYALGITGGLCLIFWLMPGAFLDFSAARDVMYQLPDWYYRDLLADREMLLKHDALRSLVYILLGAALVYGFVVAKDKKKTATYVGIGLALLILVDLWSVDKRYLSNDSFADPRTVNPFVKSAADVEILKDKDPSFRVMNLNDPFQESYTSFYHKSIGGYNAAKLRRYQELIDHHIGREVRILSTALQSGDKAATGVQSEIFRHTPVLNMLNARYVIANPKEKPVKNPEAYGSAWFAEKLELVPDADAEMLALGKADLLKTAIVDKRFEAETAGLVLRKDSTAVIRMTAYEPVKLTYTSVSATEQLAVFSEIYYPHGWQAYIDGKPVPHFRTNWVLRGMKVPAGEHTIEFKFVPEGYIAATRTASVSSVLILLFVLFAVGCSLWNWYRKEE